MGGTHRIQSVQCNGHKTVLLLSCGTAFEWGAPVPCLTAEDLEALPQAAWPAFGQAVPVPLPEPALWVAAGEHDGVGITHARRVRTWGGQGLDAGDAVLPALQAAPRGVVAGDACTMPMQALDARGSVYAVIDRRGHLYTWGENPGGALGRLFVAGRAPAGRILGLPAMRWVSVGPDYMLALSVDGRLYGWGANQHGQLGREPDDEVSMARPLLEDSRFHSVSAGRDHAAGITVCGRLYTWGANDTGQLGRDGTWQAATVRLPERIESVAAGDGFTIAAGRSGRLYAWGLNDRGQLGLGDTHPRSKPARQRSGRGVLAVAAGRAHAVAVTPGGVVGWGDNEQGQIGALAPVQLRPECFFA